jgi:predicted ATPase
MISRISVRNFKRFKGEVDFTLSPNDVTYLAGGNNSGKSTLLQALAVWEFARYLVEINKGRSALNAGAHTQGVGVSTEEFSPLALPSLKYLWSDLRVFSGLRGDGYSLRIRCHWEATSLDRYLEFGLALSNDRLFLKPTDSNLTANDLVPRLAYLPPFAGIGPREERLSPATRRRWIGRGLAGGVLRNLLYDFWSRNHKDRKDAKSPSGRLSNAVLGHLRKTDSWEQLLLVLEEVFKTGLEVRTFNEMYHTTIEILAWEGQLVNKRFRKKPGNPSRDLMVEGSGFLQWLSVYALALNKELDVLLLDEPDAHLHPALQGHLIQKLGQLARENNKQVLLATHSTTILSETKVEQIFRMEERDYLKNEGGRISLFVGLGSQYAPRLDQLKRHKRMFLHDGPSDLEILQAWAQTLGHSWPDNLVSWKYTKNREAREILFAELRAEIPGLRAISLQDRDDYPFRDTASDLTFDSLSLFYKGLGLRRWRRRNIENYLLHPAAIARAAGRLETDVRQFLEQAHGLSITSEFNDSACQQTLANTDGKDILTKHSRSISAEFGVEYQQIAEAMLPDEIPDDCKTLLGQITELCRT